MKFLLNFTAVFFALSCACYGQQSNASPSPELFATNITDLNRNEGLPIQDRIYLKLPVSPPAQTAGPYVRPDAKTRTKRYLNNLIGPYALAPQVVRAGVSTWRNSPEEWGDGWEGFGRRTASNLGENTIRQTAIYGLDEAFKLDSHFYRSQKKDARSKLKNALISPVTARSRSGKRVIGFPRIIGAYGSSIVAYQTWYPDRYNYKDGLKSGTISLGINAAFNIFKEFVLKK